MTVSTDLSSAIGAPANSGAGIPSAADVKAAGQRIAQAVALAARLFGTTAVIVMPADAPRVKMDKTRAYGGEVVTYERYTEDRAMVSRRLAAERGLTLVPPYDDRHVIAGQGTLGLEMISQAACTGAKLEALLVCCSGGGLAAGRALAFEEGSPATAIYTVEPQGFDDTARSLVAGHRVANESGAKSICDAILGNKPGELTFRINQTRLTPNRLRRLRVQH
jgi:threonine dehydratase